MKKGLKTLKLFYKYMYTAYGNYQLSVADSAPSVRASFIRKTYSHLAGAILGFIVLEFVLINLPFAEGLVELMMGAKWSWIIVLVLFVGVSWVAQWWAASDADSLLQYLGLGLFVLAESIILFPIIHIANSSYDGVIWQAALMTFMLFGGLTLTVLVTQEDFRFLYPILTISGLIAFGYIILALAFGFTTGILFSVIMVALAAGCILYETSNVLHTYKPNQYVLASLSLFASIALLFIYILRILITLASDD